MNNISVSLGNHFGGFVEDRVSRGRYKSVDDIILAGLRLLEEEEAEEEKKLQALRAAIKEGEESGEPVDFDLDAFLESMRLAADNGEV